MMDFDNDDIAKWAENLTPEGSPGAMAAMMRGLLGDQGYEKAMERNEATLDLGLQRQKTINSALAIAVFFFLLGGLLSLVLLTVFTLRTVF